MRTVKTAGMTGPCSLRARSGARGIAALGAIGLITLLISMPLARAVDTDGDGVDDASDCRPTDGTTWSVSTQARNLALSGGANTSFGWLAPSPAPGTTVYDVLRTNGPGSWASAVCLLSNTTATSAPFLDATTPSNIYFYLVRAKTACGGALGQNSSGTPTTGTNCSLAEGQSCAVNAACNSGDCCSGNCRILTNDINNCGSCGAVCAPAHAVPACNLGSCGINGCIAPFRNCNGLTNDGCEINSGNDVANCGQCGQACNATNGTPSCTNGFCGISCFPPFNNCDGSLNNGCETNTATSVTNCGSCGNVCPGNGQTTGTASCSGSACTFTCNGENYDVNNNASDGCERADNPTNNHSAGFATSLGSHDCTDGTISWSGIVDSDTRTHSPAVPSFNGTVGAAPDVAAISATGGICTNDFSFTLTTSGGGATVCYQLSVITTTRTVTCTATGAGVCTASFGSGAYPSSTTINLKVEKTCSSSIREHVTYTVQGHI